MKVGDLVINKSWPGWGYGFITDIGDSSSGKNYYESYRVFHPKINEEKWYHFGQLKVISKS